MTQTRVGKAHRHRKRLLLEPGAMTDAKFGFYVQYREREQRWFGEGIKSLGKKKKKEPGRAEEFLPLPDIRQLGFRDRASA